MGYMPRVEKMIAPVRGPSGRRRISRGLRPRPDGAPLDWRMHSTLPREYRGSPGRRGYEVRQGSLVPIDQFPCVNPAREYGQSQQYQFGCDKNVVIAEEKSASLLRPPPLENHLIRPPRGPLPVLRRPHRPGQQRQPEDAAGE